VSESTLRRSRKDEGDIFQSTKYPHGVKRTRLSEEDIIQVQQFLDENIPIQSGRNFRVQRCTDEKLYADYFVQCCEANTVPVSKSTFFYKLLKKEKIHHHTNDPICQYCNKLERTPKEELTEDELEELERHQKTWFQQSIAYKGYKKRLIEQKDPTKFLILQDFSQLQAQSNYFQDLIIVLMCYNPDAEGGLQVEYFHFVGSETSTKNDIGFVISAWKDLIAQGFFEGCTEIVIFSDGGPKHFKITACMSFFAALQTRLKIPISYNFF
jgi:hypothetical protein